MRENYTFSNSKVSEKATINPYTEKIKWFMNNKLGFVSKTIIPKVTEVLFKLHILKEIDESADISKDSEETIRMVNAANMSKQSALLDMAVITSPELQDCIIEERTLRQMVVEFQVIKNKLFLENHSPNGNFVYEGALVEQTFRHFEEMSAVLKKLYIDLFRSEIYPYNCSKVLEFSADEILDDAWMGKVCEKLSNYHHAEILFAEYPVEVLNKFKFMYMLIKLQEVKYDALMKTRSRV